MVLIKNTSADGFTAVWYYFQVKWRKHVQKNKLLDKQTVFLNWMNCESKQRAKSITNRTSHPKMWRFTTSSSTERLLNKLKLLQNFAKDLTAAAATTTKPPYLLPICPAILNNISNDLGSD